MMLYMAFLSIGCHCSYEANNDSALLREYRTRRMLHDRSFWIAPE